MSGNKRRSYSVDYKKQIVEESLNKNLTAFCKNKELNLRMVRKWRAEFDNFGKRVDEGNGEKRKLGSGRKSYSINHKKQIVEESYNQNLSDFCRQKKLNLRMVRKWRAELDIFSKCVDEGNGKKRKLGSGRQPLFLDLEHIVAEWIVERRTKGLVVCKADVRAFALEIAQELDISPDLFKASYHWLDKFFQRYEFSSHRSTNLLKEEDSEII